MVGFEKVAVFILATTKTNGRGKQDYPTYLESRLVPIWETWGQSFPHLHFVLGRNKFDHDFLHEQCIKRGGNSTEGGKVGNRPKGGISEKSGKGVKGDGRHLASRSKQVRSEDRVDVFSCPIYQAELRYGAKTSLGAADAGIGGAIAGGGSPNRFTALWAGNCTGEYFGIGPSCRCQESMRYFNSAPDLAQAEWFVFADDDLYLRPHALASMLGGLQLPYPSLPNPNSKLGAQASASGPGGGLRGLMGPTGSAGESMGGPLALVAPQLYRSFDFSRRKINGSRAHGCRNNSAFDFPLAQPAIINRAAMQHMRSAIDSNALTGLQAEWGGTHDALLGMLLWMYKIPTLSFSKMYHGGQLMLTNGTIPTDGTSGDLNSGGQLQYVFYHRVMNCKTYVWRPAERKFRLKHVVAGQYEIAQLLGDDVLYRTYTGVTAANTTTTNTEFTITIITTTTTTPPATTTAAINQIREQQRAGLGAVARLVAMQPSGISRTVFASKAYQIHQQYEAFSMKDCALLAA